MAIVIKIFPIQFHQTLTEVFQPLRLKKTLKKTRNGKKLKKVVKFKKWLKFAILESLTPWLIKIFQYLIIKP